MEKRRTIVLAEAGSGKSSEFDYQCSALRQANRFAFKATVRDVADAGHLAADALDLDRRNVLAADLEHVLVALDVEDGAALTDAYAVASRVLGSVRLHGGVAVTAAAFGDETIELRPTARPFGGVEWTPSIYPRTSVLGDVTWAPRFAPDRIAMEWVADWGVRYQALRWGSIELAVRHREDEGLADSRVMIRVNGVFGGGALLR